MQSDIKIIKFVLSFLCWCGVFNLVRLAAMKHSDFIFIIAIILSFIICTIIFPVFIKNNKKEQEENVDDEEL